MTDGFLRYYVSRDNDNDLGGIDLRGKIDLKHFVLSEATMKDKKSLKIVLEAAHESINRPHSPVSSTEYEFVAFEESNKAAWIEHIETHTKWGWNGRRSRVERIEQ